MKICQKTLSLVQPERQFVPLSDGPKIGQTNVWQASSQITKDQKQQIKEVLKQPPSDQGIPNDFWDVSALKQYISTQFDTVYESDQSYHFLLKFSNLSFKYPDTFDIRRDEELIAVSYGTMQPSTEVK